MLPLQIIFGYDFETIIEGNLYFSGSFQMASLERKTVNDNLIKTTHYTYKLMIERKL